MKGRISWGNGPNPKAVFPLAEHLVQWEAYKHAMWLPTRCFVYEKLSFKTIQITSLSWIREGQALLIWYSCISHHWFNRLGPFCHLTFCWSTLFACNLLSDDGNFNLFIYCTSYKRESYMISFTKCVLSKVLKIELGVELDKVLVQRFNGSIKGSIRM